MNFNFFCIYDNKVIFNTYVFKTNLIPEKTQYHSLFRKDVMFFPLSSIPIDKPKLSGIETFKNDDLNNFDEILGVLFNPNTGDLVGSYITKSNNERQNKTFYYEEDRNFVLCNSLITEGIITSLMETIHNDVDKLVDEIERRIGVSHETLRYIYVDDIKKYLKHKHPINYPKPHKTKSKYSVIHLN